MKIFDEGGNFLGEFVEDSKDKISDSFDESVGYGCATLLYMILLIVIVAIVWWLFKGVMFLGKFFLKVMWWLLRLAALSCWWLLQEIAYGIWWLVRVPFTLVFYKEVPDWWSPEWRLPEWEDPQ